ncbi:hypothetical protein R3P38DRAFT_3172678 [Favolaschia claudopus]|uniref:Chromo domain-containing protein n=1 Tax=Favolaschia claudopus TaxID=2862362 RepID=A0AAW0DKR2_9AGAR
MTRIYQAMAKQKSKQEGGPMPGQPQTTGGKTVPPPHTAGKSILVVQDVQDKQEAKRARRRKSKRAKKAREAAEKAPLPSPEPEEEDELDIEKPRKKAKKAPPSSPESDQPSYEVTQVSKARVTKKEPGKPRHFEFLTHWAEPGSHPSWEPEWNLNGGYAVKLFWSMADVEPPLRKGEIPKPRDFVNNTVIELNPKLVAARQAMLQGDITGTQVFALWEETEQYYHAVVMQRDGKRFEVHFLADQIEKWVDVNDIRRVEDIRPGDRIILLDYTSTVGSVDKGIITPALPIGVGYLQAYALAKKDVEEQWSDRLVDPDHLLMQLK